MKKLHSGPEFREKLLNGIKKRNEETDFKKQQSKRIKKLHLDPEFRKKRLDGMKKLHSDPKFRNKVKKAVQKSRSKPFKTPDKKFLSSCEAAKFYNLTSPAVRYRLKSKSEKFKDWVYLEGEELENFWKQWEEENSYDNN